MGKSDIIWICALIYPLVLIFVQNLYTNGGSRSNHRSTPQGGYLKVAVSREGTGGPTGTGATERRDEKGLEWGRTDLLRSWRV